MKLRNQILAANGIVILLFVSAGVLVYQRVSLMRESAVLLRQSDKAIQAANQVKLEILNMETGSRGYLVTGREKYLEPFYLGEQGIEAALDHSEQILAGYPEQIYRLDRVRELSNEWLNTVGRRQNAIRQQIKEGERITQTFEKIRASTTGEVLFDRIRRAISDLEKELNSRDNLQADHLLHLLQLNLVNQQAGLRGFLLNGEEEALSHFTDNVILFDDQVRELTALFQAHENEEALVQNLQEVVDLAVKWREEVAQPNIEARRRVNQVEVTEANLDRFMEAGDGKRLTDQIRGILDRMIEFEVRQLEGETLKNQQRAKEAKALILMSSALAALAAILATIFISRRVLGQIGGEPREIAKLGQRIAEGNFNIKLDNKTGDKDSMYESFRLIAESFTQVVEQTREVAEGNFDKPIELRSKEDQLGLALQRMATNLADQTRAGEREKWLRQGQTQLDARMRGDLDRREMTGNVLGFLAEYLEAQVAVFYIGEGEGFQLVNSYALKQDKTIRAFFKDGEGLVGQAARERKLIHFKGVPEGHVNVHITSGTGGSAPKSILVVPFIHDDEVLGVLEIGSASEFDERALDFVERSHAAIAISLFAMLARERAKLLVEELENQSAELETQREDLQKTNAALEEQSQTLKESQAELESQREELLVNNEQLDQRGQELENKNTELEAARKALEEKAEALELSGRYKSQFMSNMSHELRTPLNSLLLLSESLMKNKKGNLDDKQVEFAETIHSSGEELLNLINEILDSAKIESGAIDLHIEPYPLVELKDYVISRFKHVAEEKGLELPVHYEENLPAEIQTDKAKLQQVVKNLLSNALKFTEKGSVSFEVYRPDANDFLQSYDLASDDYIALSIKDTGIGISDAHRQSVFDAFQQADGRTNRKYGGTGLGLTISKQLVEILGGRIELQSEVDIGSTFTVYLPLASASQADPPEAPPEARAATDVAPGAKDSDKEAISSAGSAVEDDRNTIEANDRTLLIIEDDLKFANIVAETAREHHFKVIIATDGLSGLELAKKYLPSAIVLDVGLPRADGWQVIEKLKRSTETRHIPVNFISAEDRNAKARMLGAMDFLTKPVSREALESVFEKTEQFLDKSIKHLLLVEDDENLGKAMVHIIGDGDVETTLVKSGQEALEKLPEDQFDCIVLDLGLGDMSGFDLLQQIHEDENYGKIPVIVYTGRELTLEEEHRLKKMSDSIIIKGVNAMERLLSEVSLFLHRVVEKLPEEKQRILSMNREEDLAGKVALVVDDDAKNTYAITNLLEEAGVTCEQAFDGNEALAKLKGSEGYLDIILTDIMMPEMDGYELIRKIRGLDAYKRIPIIALTANAMKGDRDKSIEAGADDYLSKPIDSSKLMSLVRVWLS